MGKQRLSAEITIGSVLDKSVRKNIGVLRGGFERIGESIKSVKTRQKELSRQRQDLVKQGKLVEVLDREYEDLERTLEALVRKQRRWERAMRDSKRVGDTFGKMVGNIGRLGRQVGLGLTAAGAGIFALTSSTAAYGDKVAKTAGKLGIGIEALQEFRYAAERSGVSTESFDSSLTAMQKRLGEAAKGTGAAKKVLDQLGLSAKELVKIGPENAMAAIADKLRDIESPAERAAIAAALFSRSGIGMVNMLGDGSEALQKLRADARKTGYVLSKEAARDAEAFADAQLDAQLVVKGLKNTIGAEFMPVVTRSMKQFSAWAVENREDVAAFANTAVTRLEAALPVIGQVVEGMGRVSSTIGSVIAKVARMVGGWENFGMIVGAVFAAKTIGSVVSFAVAVGRLGVSMARLVGAGPLVASGIKMIGRALLMNPIGLAVAAIAGSAVLIYQNWEKVGPWFSEFWGDVSETFQGVGGFIGGVWRGDMDAAADGLSMAWTGAKSALSTTLDGIGAVFKFAWSKGIKPITDKLGVTDSIEAAWSKLGAWYSQYWDGVEATFAGFAGFVGGAWRGDMDAAAGGLSMAWDGAKTALSTTLDGIGDVFKATWESGIRPITDKLGVTDSIKAAWKGAGNLFDDVLSQVGSAFSRTWLDTIKPVTDKLGVTDKITSAWQGAKTVFGTTLAQIGGVFQENWDGSIGGVIAKLQDTGGVQQAWADVKSALQTVLDWLGQKFDWLMEKLQPVLEGLTWLRDKGAGAVEGVSGIGSAIGDWWSGKPDEPETPNGASSNATGGAQDPAPAEQRRPAHPLSGKAKPKSISGSYLGGDIGRGFRNVGEQGPETIWASKGNYVAHAGATERLAQLSARAAPLFDALGGGLRQAMAGAQETAQPVIEKVRGAAERIAPMVAPAPAPAPQPAPITITATIHAQGMSAADIADELERRGRDAQAGSLFDAPHSYGQYGGA
jgi:hypothetical protein